MHLYKLQSNVLQKPITKEALCNIITPIVDLQKFCEILSNYHLTYSTLLDVVRSFRKNCNFNLGDFKSVPQTIITKFIAYLSLSPISYEELIKNSFLKTDQVDNISLFKLEIGDEFTFALNAFLETLDKRSFCIFVERLQINPNNPSFNKIVEIAKRHNLAIFSIKPFDISMYLLKYANDNFRPFAISNELTVAQLTNVCNILIDIKYEKDLYVKKTHFDLMDTRKIKPILKKLNERWGTFHLKFRYDYFENVYEAVLPNGQFVSNRNYKCLENYLADTLIKIQNKNLITIHI